MYSLVNVLGFQPGYWLASIVHVFSQFSDDARAVEDLAGVAPSVSLPDHSL
jgi:hypothetical protein